MRDVYVRAESYKIVSHGHDLFHAIWLLGGLHCVSVKPSEFVWWLKFVWLAACHWNEPQCKGKDTACEIKLLSVPIIYTHKNGLAFDSKNDPVTGSILLVSRRVIDGTPKDKSLWLESCSLTLSTAPFLTSPCGVIR
jgi:hypothetical protein